MSTLPNLISSAWCRLLASFVLIFSTQVLWAQGANQDEGENAPETTDAPSVNGANTTGVPLELQLNVLIVDIARVRSSALAYQSIQQETERVRDLVNAIYQERLDDLQKERDDLIEREREMTSQEFQESIADLERRAIDLENKRRQNFSTLEKRRQEASNIADIQLNSVLAALLRELGASYILNQQSALVWPDAANVTNQAIERLDQILSSVSFTANFSLQEE